MAGKVLESFMGDRTKLNEKSLFIVRRKMCIDGICMFIHTIKSIEDEYFVGKCDCKI